MKFDLFNPLPPSVTMADDALASNIGKPIHVRGPRDQVYPGTIVDARVHVGSLDQRGYTLTIEVADLYVIL